MESKRRKKRGSPNPSVLKPTRKDKRPAKSSSPEIIDRTECDAGKGFIVIGAEPVVTKLLPDDD